MLAWARRIRADSFSREVVACSELNGDGPYCVAETVAIHRSRVRTLRHSSEASAAYGRVQRWSKVLRLIGTDLALGDEFARSALVQPLTCLPGRCRPLHAVTASANTMVFIRTAC